MIAGRLLLEYGGEGYENRTMQMSKPDWLAYKTSLGFDFPNLPYYQVRASFRHYYFSFRRT